MTPHFRSFCEYFQDEVSDSKHRLKIRKEYQKKGASEDILQQVASLRVFNQERNELIRNVEKKAAALHNTTCFPILEAIQGAVSMTVHVLETEGKCDICGEQIPFPRKITFRPNPYITKDLQWEGAEKTFIVRSDFIPMLCSFYIVSCFEPLTVKTIRDHLAQDRLHLGWMKRHFALYSYAKERLLSLITARSAYHVE